jgi:hypothetical protein
MTQNKLALITALIIAVPLMIMSTFAVFENKDSLGGISNTSNIKESFPIETIDKMHNEIHEGEHYFVCGFDTLASAASTTFSLRTPSSTV